MKSVMTMLALSALLTACARSDVQALSTIDRQLSARVAEQVRRCYRYPRMPSAGRRIVTRLLVRYAPDGMVVGLPLLVWQQGVTPETRPYAGRMAEAAKQAVVRCSPVSLPEEPGKADARTREFYLTFSPQMKA